MTGDVTITQTFGPGVTTTTTTVTIPGGFWLASFGAFVQLQDDIDGLVHISQLSEEHVAKVKDVLKVGQEVTARVIKIDKADRSLSNSGRSGPCPAPDHHRPGGGGCGCAA